MNNGVLSRALVIIPTYNEREMLPETVKRLRAAQPHVDILIVDDGSPDGTGDLADAMAGKDSAIAVMHREEKQGLGPAYIAGFQWALEREYDVVVEMDADASHQPEQLDRLLTRIEESDQPALVLGSRWVPGGNIVDWPRHREFLSRGGNAYVKMVLGLKVGDATGGYRAYRSTALQQINWDEVASSGYCFQVDMTRRVLDLPGKIVEVPITFVERREGTSKMNHTIVLEALWRVTVWGISRRSRQVVQALRRN